ncbi:NUT family member 2G-like isoform X1 [Callithrix jacchus]
MPGSVVKRPSCGEGTEHAMHTREHLQAAEFPCHTPSAVGHPSDSPVTTADLETPAHSPLSFVSTACPVPKLGVTENPGASVPVFTALSFATPAPSPAHGPPLVTVVVPPAGPPVLSALPGNPLVAGQDGRGPNWTAAANVFGQMMTAVGPVNAPQAQSLVLTRAPLVWRDPGAVCQGVACPPPRPLAAAPVVPAMVAHIRGGTQACEGGWSQGLPPPAPPPAPQLAPIMVPGNACPWPQGAHGEGSQAPSQAKAQPDDSRNPKSVYENFRLWQRYKPLARRHLPQSPDTEALSCFFIPVLRSLARRKPSMTMEEGLRWAMREWQHTSNSERKIFYQMAAKFLEFEAEEMQIQKLQWMMGPQGRPLPALPRLEPQGPSAPEVVKEPVDLPSKAGPKAPPACLPPHTPQRPAEIKAHLPPPRPQQLAETKAPEEIPPQVVQEYVDIMEELLGTPVGATGEFEGQWEEGEEKQQGDGMFLDPGVLSYVDNLCSQKDFVTKVEAVIHPRFLEELLSPDPKMDFLALSQELEQEEGLTLAQVEQGGRGTQVPHLTAYNNPLGDARLLGGLLRGGEVQVQTEQDGEEPGRGVRMQTAVRPSKMPGRDTPSVSDRKPSYLRLPCLPPKCLGLHHPGPCSHVGQRQKMPRFLPQVAEKRLQSLEEERRERAAPSHGTTQLDSLSPKSAVGQGAERDVPGPQQGVSMETCPPRTAARDPQGQGRVCIRVAKNPVVLLERLDSGRLRAARPDSPPQDQRPTCPGVGTQDTWGLPGASPVKESRRLCKRSSGEERKIPGMVSVVGTHYRLRPWKLSQSPVPASGLLSPEGRGPPGALQSRRARRGLSPAPAPAPAPATTSKKRALCRGLSPAVQMPHLRPGLRVSGAQSSAWGPPNTSQSPKRKGDPLLSKSKKKQHRSQ